MIDGLRVSVILPCLNEAEGLRQMLPQMPAWVDEVVVVDNNSTDDTAAIAQAHGASLVREPRSGYGWACLRGLREASGCIIVKLDGDCTYPVDAIRVLVETMILEELEFVSGCRFPLRDARAMRWQSRVGNHLLTAAANACFGLSLGDSLSGMWAIRRSAASRLPLAQDGIPFSQEIKVEAFALAGLRCREVPIGYYSRVGTSKLMPLRDGLACLRYLAGRRLSAAGCAPGLRSAAAFWSERVAFAAVVGAAMCAPLLPSVKEACWVLAVLAWLVSKAATRCGLPTTTATLPLAAWFLAGVLSISHSVSLLASVSGLRKVFKVAALFFVVVDVARTRRRVWLLLSAVLFGASLTAVDGLLQLLFGADPLYGNLPGNAPGGFPRLTGPYHHANDFGLYAVTALPLCIAVALTTTRAGGRRWAWGAAGLLGVAMLLTWSRVAMLAVVVALLTFAMIRGAWKTLTACAALGALALLALPAPLQAWAVSQGSWFDALVQPQRPQIWQAAINMIKAHPIVGVGVNTFVLNYERYKLPIDDIHAAYAHNHYLHMAAEMGLIGLAAFAWLIVRVARVWRGLLGQPDPWIRTVAAGVGCSVVGFLVTGLLESSLYSSRTNLNFWLCLGLLCGLHLHFHPPTAPSSGTPSVPPAHAES